MKIGDTFQRLAGRTMLMALLCSAPATTPASEVDTEELGGWKQDYIETPKSRDELDVSLPDYPQEKNLMDLGIATDGMQYTVYLDKPTLQRGEDGVVRYTVVLVPPSGIWNVTYEGLRCGERQYRRYAYGIDGSWQPMNNSPWRDVQGSGANRYRGILYEKYFCNPLRSNWSAEEMIKSFTETWHEEM
jgi:hypothetical protein